MEHVLSEPAIYHLELTAACDHACPGCSNSFARLHANPPPPLPATGWDGILRKIGPGAAHLRLTGGEPTLHPDFSAILTAASRYDAWITLSTHGHWAQPEALLDRLDDVPRLAGLLISVHGASAATHEAFNGTPRSFTPTLDNARRAAARGLPVALSAVITHHNWREIDALIRLADEIGAQEVVFNRYVGRPLPGIEPTEDELAAAIASIEAADHPRVAARYGIGIPQCFVANRSEGCLAGVALASVDPWGNLHPCAFSPTIVGSLLEAPLRTLWLGEEMTNFRQRTPTVCARSCVAYARCHGGCRAIQELRSDGYDPLRRAPLHTYDPPITVRELPGGARPVLRARLRREAFGYALLGQGQVLLIRPEARALIDACDGTHTFSELALRYGEGGLSLLGELWEAGLLRTEAPHKRQVHGTGC